MLGLMGMNNKKGAAEAIIANLIDDKTPKMKENDPKMDVDLGLSSAAEELLMAITDQNPGSLSKVLDNFVEMKINQMNSREPVTSAETVKEDVEGMF